MRRFWYAPVVTLLVGAQPLPCRAQEVTASRLWNQVQGIRWDTTYTTWRPQHALASCSPFTAPPQEVIDGTGASELWSHRCAQESAGTTSEWLFYAFNPRPPVVERVEQVRVSVGNLPVDQLEAVARDLSTLVSNTYGAPASEQVTEFGSAFWRHPARWRTNDVEVVLGVDEFPNRPPRLKVFMRHQPLLDALAIRQRLENATLSGDVDPGTLPNPTLAGLLGSAFAQPGALLRASSDSVADPPTLVNAVTTLLEAANTGAADRVCPLQLAADRLAGRVAMSDRESDEGRRQRDQLAAHGLSFEWDELGGTWVYTHDLLWRLWTTYPGTRWGEEAFLALLSRGWDTHVACRDGSDRFRLVIANSDAFLRANRETPLRAQVLLLLAQAHETWWSLSLASDRDEYVDRRNYQSGALRARRNAIATYDELLQRYGRSQQADFARLALPRLSLGIDTGQRRFFCVYD